MCRLPAFALAALTLAGLAAADDKKEKKDGAPALSGTWLREAGGLDLTVTFAGKDTVTISAFNGDNGVAATCTYATEKGGVVKAKITKVVLKGDFKTEPPKGLELSFKWAVKGDTATLDNFKAEGLEHAKEVLEGEYDREKEKKDKK